MTAITTPLLLTAAGIVLVAVLFALLRSRKNSILSHQYSAALLAENNGDFELAIQLYKEALQQIHETKIGDKKLFKDTEERLKTLLISTDFEKSFRKKILSPA